MGDKTYSCSFCDYKTNKKYNLDRHETIKHAENEGSIRISSMSNGISLNSIDISPTSIPIGSISTNISTNSKQCDKCDKIFAKRCTMIKHKEKCIGKINKLECIYCKFLFTTASAKCRHQKTCKEKDKQLNDNNVQIQTQTNIQTQNNITNNIQTQNNITNNIQIIAFNPDDECIFVKTEAFNKQIKKLLMQYTNELKLIKNYNRNLFLIKENQCVKKTNLRSIHSKVHMGDNKWKTVLDKNVYPKLVSDYANDFCNLILAENRARHKSLERKLDCIADGAYINDTPEVQKKLITDYNELVNDLKLMAYEE